MRSFQFWTRGGGQSVFAESEVQVQLRKMCEGRKRIFSINGTTRYVALPLTSKLCILAADLVKPRIPSLWKQILVTVDIPHAICWFSSSKTDRKREQYWIMNQVKTSC